MSVTIETDAVIGVSFQVTRDANGRIVRIKEVR